MAKNKETIHKETIVTQLLTGFISPLVKAFYRGASDEYEMSEERLLDKVFAEGRRIRHYRLEKKLSHCPGEKIEGAAGLRKFRKGAHVLVRVDQQMPDRVDLSIMKTEDAEEEHMFRMSPKLFTERVLPSLVSAKYYGKNIKS